MKIIITENQLKRLTSNLIKENKDDNPCWDGYKQIGMKTKDGKEVPNCVPIDESIDESTMVLEDGGQCDKVTQKTSSSRSDKKWMKCAKQADGSIKRVHWGDPNAKVTGDSGDTERKENFRARHNCDSAKKGTPRDMACKDW